MEQYHSIKAHYPDAMLLFRVGDFYETFGPDAVKCAQLLNIVLTKRSNSASTDTDLAGFPHHALDTYLPKLVRSGLRVAICDQLEDPKKAKTIIKRGVTELVTPGVALNDQVLEARSNNFLAALHLEKDKIGLAFLDISTGEFFVSEGTLHHTQQLIQRFYPSEIVYQKQQRKMFEQHFSKNHHTYTMEDWAFQYPAAYEKLTQHFQTSSLKGFGIEGLSLGIIAAAVILHYLSDTRHDRLKHISTIRRIEEDQYVWMDDFTLRNLEIISPTSEKGMALIDVLDKTISPMGARLLKRWISLPLKNISQIKKRQKALEQFLTNESLSRVVSDQLKQIADIERLISKIATERISPREVMVLFKSLEAVVMIKTQFSASRSEVFKVFGDRIQPCDLLRERIAKTVAPEPPHQINKGNVILQGVSSELDRLRQLVYASKDYLEQLCQHERKRTGINSLKIAFNHVFGYYIEVRNVHRDKVPADWIRKQTLVNAERYVTEELKDYETQILGAEEKILSLETRLFQELVQFLAGYIKPLQLNAQWISRIDVFRALAVCASENNYVRPDLDESFNLYIKGGRHPLIEKQLPLGTSYVANDILLNQTDQQIVMITGPNMSGKSAVLRQTALIVLMAQIGSYVPAKQAKLGWVDKIFSRVGASDNISMGESTFMVEMNETAGILNNISKRSLLILDEIGRGTSTYDGISIAWAIVEYLHGHSSCPKTLFATHYHELNEMAHFFERIKNYNVSVKDIDGHIIFIRELIPGGSEHSFGIHVAKMAGMPTQVIRRSTEILKTLERSHLYEAIKQKNRQLVYDNMQLSFFQFDGLILKAIRDQFIKLDINTLTHVDALIKLNEIKKILG
ncbi:MAG: DNA mismatch repair protein MutS [Flavobacteriales bacterium AspAUS03]